MANITFMAGTSHGPLLSTPPEQWDLRVQSDKMRLLDFKGEKFSFGDLVSRRNDENLNEKSSLEKRKIAYQNCRSSIERLRNLWNKNTPDVLIILGNDQREIFDANNQPSFAISYSNEYENVPYSEVELSRLAPGLAIAEHGHHDNAVQKFPGHSDLSLFITSELIENDYDICSIENLPNLEKSYSTGLPHAYGFVYRQIIADRIIPAVPIFINTFYTPNQPTAKRCFDFGKNLAKVLKSYPNDIKIGIIASGGMSHFVVDEELDITFLNAVQKGNPSELLKIPKDRYLSGSSELKNWIPLAGIISEDNNWNCQIDYIPCYRSEAGTGSGMAFATWIR